MVISHSCGHDYQVPPEVLAEIPDGFPLSEVMSLYPCPPCGGEESLSKEERERIADAATEIIAERFMPRVVGFLVIEEPPPYHEGNGRG